MLLKFLQSPQVCQQTVGRPASRVDEADLDPPVSDQRIQIFRFKAAFEVTAEKDRVEDMVDL